MCGLFGIAGIGIIQSDLHILENMGLFSQVRGQDGTGYFEINSRGKTGGRILKMSEDHNYFTHKNNCRPANEKVLNSVMMTYIMGHVRSATSGSYLTKDCHPFNYSNLVGAHNGTLKHPDYEKVPGRVDSDLMFEDINQHGLKPVLEKLTDKCAYAITMYDKVSKDFIFARNDKRPLAFAINKKRSVLYWMSEMDMLRFTLRRQREECEFFTLVPGIWSTNIARIRSDNLAIFEGEELKKEVPPAIIHTVTRPSSKITPLFKRGCELCKRDISTIEQYEMATTGQTGWYDTHNDHYYCYSCTNTTAVATA